MSLATVRTPPMGTVIAVHTAAKAGKSAPRQLFFVRPIGNGVMMGKALVVLDEIKARLPQ